MEKTYHIKNNKTGVIVKTTSPLSVVQHLQKKKEGVLDLSIDIYKAFNRDYTIIKIQ